MAASGPMFNGYHDHGMLCQPEEDEDRNSLVYSNDGVLMSGPLDSLVLHLVPTGQYYPEQSYIFTFLLGSRLFLDPLPLMTRVCQTCVVQQGLKSEKVNTVMLQKFGRHMIRLLGEWTDTFPYDFLDDQMLKSLKDMMKLLVDIDPELKRDVSILNQNLLSKIASLNKYKEILTKIDSEATQKLESGLPIGPQVEISDVCPVPVVLGEQLTHIELERLSMIGPEEFIDELRKQTKVPASKEADGAKTSNIAPYAQWYDRLSYFVATEICTKLRKRHRVHVIEYFVDVAKECINIGNFNSLMAIISGLNMTCVQRLKKTWAKINREKFEILEHQSNPSNNFSSYRSSLKAALWRSEGASDDRQRIVVPFFSLLIKDICIVHEGYSNLLPNGHVNFEKQWEISKKVHEFMSWKSVECPFERHPAILNYLLTNPVLADNALDIASYECEQPENSYEKQHYKQLRETTGI